MWHKEMFWKLLIKIIGIQNSFQNSVSISLQKQLSIRIESMERHKMGYFGFHFLFPSSLVKRKVENYVGDDVYTKIN